MNKRISLRTLRREWLRSKLAGPPADVKKTALDFFNQPIVLWMLSSIALGLAGYLYGNFTTCRNAQLIDEQILHRNLGELSDRLNTIVALSRSKEVPSVQLAQEKRAIDPEHNYIYLENKGRGETELRHVIAGVFNKWGAWQDIKKLIGTPHPVYDYSWEKFAFDHKFGGSTLLELNDYEERTGYIFAFFIKYEDVIDTIQSDTMYASTEDQQKHVVESVRRAEGLGEVISLTALTRFLRPGYCYKRMKWPY